MKKIFVSVFAVAACCLAATPYTGLLTNLDIATFGIEDYYTYTKDPNMNLPKAVDFARSFRTSMQKYVSQQYPGTTFNGSYSNTESKQVTKANFNKQTVKNHNIVMFAGHGVDTRKGSIITHNGALMYDGPLKVEDMRFSDKTYFVFMHACNFLSFYTDEHDRDYYGFYRKKINGKEIVVTDPITENDRLGDSDEWEDSQEAKPQQLAYSKFVDAFRSGGVHAIFGFSSLSVVMYRMDGTATDPSLYDTFAQQWVQEGLRIWQAYKYAVWKIIYKKHCGPNKEINGIEPAVIFKSGTAIGNDGKQHSFKGYCLYYKSIYQYPIKNFGLGRKKAVYGKPSY